MTDLLTPPVQFEQPLSAEEAVRAGPLLAWANYLSVGQIYLLANPLLRESGPKRRNVSGLARMTSRRRAPRRRPSTS